MSFDDDNRSPDRSQEWPRCINIYGPGDTEPAFVIELTRAPGLPDEGDDPCWLDQGAPALEQEETNGNC